MIESEPDRDALVAGVDDKTVEATIRIWSVLQYRCPACGAEVGTPCEMIEGPFAEMGAKLMEPRVHATRVILAHHDRVVSVQHPIVVISQTPSLGSNDQ